MKYKIAQDFYSKISSSYHKKRYATLYGGVFKDLHHAALRQFVVGDSKELVLEVAAGTGHTTELLKECGANYISCDLTEAMLRQARERLGIDLPLVRCDANRLPFPDEKFDVVVSTRFLHLFPLDFQVRILAEMIRVLKPGGRLVVDFDNLTSRWLLAVPHFIYNVIRYRRFAPDTNYNGISSTLKLLSALGLGRLQVVGIGGYHLLIPAFFSRRFAVYLGRLHKDIPFAYLCEQFVVSGRKV